MLDICADVLSGVLLALDVLFVFLNPLFGGVIGRGGGEFRAVPSKKNIYILHHQILFIHLYFFIF